VINKRAKRKYNGKKRCFRESDKEQSNSGPGKKKSVFCFFLLLISFHTKTEILNKTAKFLVKDLKKKK